MGKTYSIRHGQKIKLWSSICYKTRVFGILVIIILLNLQALSCFIMLLT